MCSAAAGDTTSIENLLEVMSQCLAALPVRERIKACRRIGARAEGIETAAAAELIPENGDTRAAERALADPKRTRHQAKRVAKRAAVAAKNAAIADKMGSEELSAEQVDAIAQADTKTEGAASTDEKLIADLAGATGDETKGIVDKFIVDQANADSVEKEYRRQRALREVRKHRTSIGLAALTVAGDDASIDAMYRQLRSDERALHRLDGGRDVPESQHPRTRDNRMFDAFKARITGTGDPLDPPADVSDQSAPAATASTADSRPDATAADRDDSSGAAPVNEPAASPAHPPSQAAPADDADGEPTAADSADGAAPSAPRGSPPGDAIGGEGPGLRPVPSSSRYTPPAPRRPTVIAVLDLAKLAGTEPSLVAEQIGLGPIPDDILAKYLGDTSVGVDLISLVIGTDGQPLRLGRSTKDPNLAQFLALVVRDRGCVECGADPQQCHMHHRIPWNAPAKGETNIDNLVLLCSYCHHRLHQQRLTLYRDRTTRKWRKRPATPDELPPDRPRKQQQKRKASPDQPGRRRPKAA